MATEAQINANRANAQHSTGPTSSAGRLKSSHNALKTGLTGRTIVLPTDDMAAYRKFVAVMREKYSPANEVQEHIVQSIADAEWRLLRIPALEAGMYALAAASPLGVGNSRQGLFDQHHNQFVPSPLSSPRGSQFPRTGRSHLR